MVNETLFMGLFYGCSFFLIESAFLYLTKEDATGNVRFSPGFEKLSTFAMFPGSVICGLFFFEPFYALVAPFSDPIHNIGLRLLLWPLVVWAFEIFWGAYLFYGCNQTRAWWYRGRSAKLNGFIKFSFYPLWVGLGISLEFLYFMIR